MASGTIRAMLNGPGLWGETSGPGLPSMTFKNISTPILERVIQYFYYKATYDNVEISEPVPKFDMELEHVLPLMLAAHFLDC